MQWFLTIFLYNVMTTELSVTQYPLPDSTRGACTTQGTAILDKRNDANVMESFRCDYLEMGIEVDKAKLLSYPAR